VSDWVYIQTEPRLWTVGVYDGNGKFQPESDHDSSEDAAKQVHYLNGGSSQPSERDYLHDIFGTLEAIADDLHAIRNAMEARERI